MASAEHILVTWIPAIPRHSLTGAGSVGKTLLLKHLYNQEFLYRSGFYLKAELLLAGELANKS
ncbi:MAG: hypothetical protein Q7V32_05990 [Methylicorpusculum sp.]|nr:hypothetical protein [Methylicorpusculum sp.]